VGNAAAIAIAIASCVGSGTLVAAVSTPPRRCTVCRRRLGWDHRTVMNDTPAEVTDSFVPAAGRAWLTGGYDRAVAVSMRERAWRPSLVSAVARDLPSSGTVVEVGCGTGSLTVALAAARPDVTVIGVDGDPGVLAIARRKPGAGRVTWIEGFAGSFLLPTASAHVALSSPLLHHLSDADKAAALDHIADVLTDDGVLHVAAWAPHEDRRRRSARAPCSSSTGAPDRRACSTVNSRACLRPRDSPRRAPRSAADGVGDAGGVARPALSQARRDGPLDG
jgi:SAM-dependent methyltransferase